MRVMNENMQIQVSNHNPSNIAELITDLAQRIESNKSDLNSILNQDWWDRTFSKSGNIKALAENLIKQNDTISTFLNIVQALIAWNMSNSIYIHEVIRQLDYLSKKRGIDKNTYMGIAKTYLQEGLYAAVQTKKKFDSINSSIDTLKTDISNKIKKGNDQDRLINNLFSYVKEIKGIDDKQNELICELESRQNTFAKGLTSKVNKSEILNRQIKNEIELQIRAFNQLKNELASQKAKNEPIIESIRITNGGEIISKIKNIQYLLIINSIFIALIIIYLFLK